MEARTEQMTRSLKLSTLRKISSRALSRTCLCPVNTSKTFGARLSWNRKKGSC